MALYSRNCFANTNAAKTNKTAARSLRMETLEDRKLMAADLAEHFLFIEAEYVCEVVSEPVEEACEAAQSASQSPEELAERLQALGLDIITYEEALQTVAEEQTMPESDASANEEASQSLEDKIPTFGAISVQLDPLGITRPWSEGPTDEVDLLVLPIYPTN